MQLTRPHKNLVLVLSNLILWSVILLKLSREPELVRGGIKLWAVAVPFIAAAIFFEIFSKSSNKTLHAGLFLATGAAVGLTAGALLRDPGILWLGEKLWMPVGLGAMILHYWPSPNDEYTA